MDRAEVEQAHVGVGIDEGAAVIVSGDQLEVLGRGTVVILDTRGAGTHTLKAGMRTKLTDIK